LEKKGHIFVRSSFFVGASSSQARYNFQDGGGGGQRVGTKGHHKKSGLVVGEQMG